MTSSSFREAGALLQRVLRSAGAAVGGRQHNRAVFPVVSAVTEPRAVPQHIVRPPTSSPPQVYGQGECHDTPDAVGRMQRACRLAAEILCLAGSFCKPGVTTDTIDRVVHDAAIAAGAYPSPLGYQGFPKSVCTSVNNVVCHGIPDARPLMDGDIVNVDVTVFLDGVHGDNSKTFVVGSAVDATGRELVDVAKAALDAALDLCEPGRPLCELGQTIEPLVVDAGFSVCPYFIGHGVGKDFHTFPDVLHHYNREDNGVMQPGMTFTIEPCVNEGSPYMRVLGDGWTAVTKDGLRSAQFEHTILITEEGKEILTCLD